MGVPRLYRFKDVIGNVNTVRLLQTSLKKNSLPNFIILNGNPGTGKSTCAEITALYLTCENPVDGEPCLECTSCRNNIKALQSTGQSNNLVKKNLGLYNSKKDVSDLIKELFILKGGMGSNVYILEEAHSLKEQEQTAFLEEFDRLDKNTYIIVSTTRFYKLIPEFRSRALSYTFNRLNRTEGKLLFERTCLKLGINKIPANVADMVLNYTRGIPRDTVNLIHFIKDNQPTEAEIKAFLGMIDSTVFTELFQSMRYDMRTFSESLDNLLGKHTYDTVITQLKEYCINLNFLIEGDISENFNRAESKVLKEIFNSETVYKISNIMEKLNPHESTETDLKFMLLKIRQLMNSKSLGHIYSENSQNASLQSVNATKIFKEREELKQEVLETKSVTNKTSFLEFFNDGK